MVKSRSVNRNAKNTWGLERDRAAEPVRIFLTACSGISAPDIPSSLRRPTRIVRVILMNPRCLVLWTSVTLRSGVIIFFGMTRRVSATWLTVKMFSLLCPPVSHAC